MSDDDIRRDAEHVVGCSENWCHAADESDLFEAVRRAQRVAAAWLKAHPADKPDQWRWVYHDVTGNDKAGRLELRNAVGQVAATVFLYENFGDKFKYVWFVWDRRGTGGENSAEPTVDRAVSEAEAAVRRWGKFTLQEPHH